MIEWVLVAALAQDVGGAPGGPVRQEVVDGFLAEGKELDAEAWTPLLAPEAFGPYGGDRLRIGADVVVRLCTSPQVAATVGPRGLRFVGVDIEGSIDLRDAQIGFPLELDGCSIGGELRLSNARLERLSIIGTTLTRLVARGVTTRGDVVLGYGSSVVTEDEPPPDVPGEDYTAIDLAQAEIGGALDLSDAMVWSCCGRSVDLSYANVGAGVHLTRAFEAMGEVWMLNAEIAGDLDASGGRFHAGSGETAIMAELVDVGGAVFLGEREDAALGSGRPPDVQGTVVLVDATVRGSIHCNRAVLRSVAAGAGGPDSGGGERRVLVLDRARVRGSLRIDDARFHGALAAEGAEILGNFVTTNALLDHPGTPNFETLEGIALHAPGLSVARDLVIGRAVEAGGGVEVDGHLSLVGGRVGGDVVLSGSRFRNTGHSAASLTERRDLLLDLDGMQIGTDLELDDARFEGTASLLGVEVLGWLIVHTPEDARWTLDLRQASFGAIADTTDSWPEPGRLLLNGATYGALVGEAPLRRLEWIRRQYGHWPPREGEEVLFLPQPYDELSRVLRRMGYGRAANDVLVAKVDDAAVVRDMGWIEAIAHWLTQRIDHGFAPFRALYWAAGFIVLGWGTFKHAHRTGGMTEVKEHAPRFYPLVFSIDTFVPLVNFHQADARQPRTTGCFLYLWAHTVLGWVVSSLFVAGLTGIVKT